MPTIQINNQTFYIVSDIVLDQFTKMLVIRNENIATTIIIEN